MPAEEQMDAVPGIVSVVAAAIVTAVSVVMAAFVAVPVVLPMAAVMSTALILAMTPVPVALAMTLSAVTVRRGVARAALHYWSGLVPGLAPERLNWP